MIVPGSGDSFLKLPCLRARQHELKVQMSIASENEPIGCDQPKQIFSRLNRAVMKDVRAFDSSAAT
jgi:hypothetical protein